MPRQEAKYVVQWFLDLDVLKRVRDVAKKKRISDAEAAELLLKLGAEV